MDWVSLSGEERNGGEDGEGSRRVEEFYGGEIASFGLPHDGEERVGSIGMDFKLYLADGGGYVLLVENWSRRKGGKNYRLIETFSSLLEMERKGISEDFYSVEIPRKLINRAKRNISGI